MSASIRSSMSSISSRWSCSSSSLIASAPGRSSRRTYAAGVTIAALSFVLTLATPATALVSAKPPKVGKTVQFGGRDKVTVHAYKVSADVDPLLADEDGQYVAVDVEACGNGTLDPDDFELAHRDHTRSEPEAFAVQEPELDRTRLDGDCVRGWITYDIADQGRPRFVVYDGVRVVKWKIPKP